ncbi:hypothetical protein, partial [Comamonas sp.]
SEGKSVTNESRVTQNRKKRKISDALNESPMTFRICLETPPLENDHTPVPLPLNEQPMETMKRLAIQ